MTVAEAMKEVEDSPRLGPPRDTVGVAAGW